MIAATELSEYLPVVILAVLGLLFAVRRGPAGFVAALALTLAAVFLVPGDGAGLWGPFTVPSMGSFRFVWVYALLAVAWWESRAPGRASWIIGTLAFTLGSQSLPKDGRAAAFGVLSSAALLGTAISAPLLGLLAQISMRAPWFFDAALYGVLVLGLWLALRRAVADEPAPSARQPAD